MQGNLTGPLRLQETDDDRPLIGFRSRANADKWADVLRRDPCSYCGRRHVEMTVDHVHAYSRRDKRRMSRTQGLTVNGAGACKVCNEHKADTLLLLHIADNPIGSRPMQVVWANGPSMPGRLFAQLNARRPAAAWWSTLLSAVCRQPPARRDAVADVWCVRLEIEGSPHTLEIKAKPRDGATVVVHRLRWLS